jgi:hypothetical protein
MKFDVASMMFGVIGRSYAQDWPPRSPDLNPLHYNVWGYMKVLVYA